jgi:hypothetical protein
MDPHSCSKLDPDTDPHSTKKLDPDHENLQKSAHFSTIFNSSMPPLSTFCFFTIESHSFRYQNPYLKSISFIFTFVLIVMK